MRPLISRKPLVLVMLVCLALSGILIPVGAHLPRWIEAEIVLAAWWVIWVGMLTYLLYQGHVVDDDALEVKFRSGKTGDLLNPFDMIDPLSGCLDGGCQTLALGVLAIGLLIGAVFVMVEFVIPAVAVLLLLSIGGMIARAVNDTNACQGRFGVALLWGSIWSTLYIGPIAALILWLPTILHHPR